MSIVSVCAILFVFKYFNFFNNNLAALAKVLHWNYPIKTLRLILPIGLSFHTFQSLSYVIEVYAGRQRGGEHFGLYALYVMYFPQLVAGPIERPQNLLHQFQRGKHFDWQRSLARRFVEAFGACSRRSSSPTAWPISPTRCTTQHAAHRHLPAHGGHLLRDSRSTATSRATPTSRIGISQVYGHRADEEFRPAVLREVISEFWSPLAHLAIDLVSRLPLHPAGRQSRASGAEHVQHGRGVPDQRAVARRELDVRDLGCLARVLLSGVAQSRARSRRREKARLLRLVPCPSASP